MQYRLQVYNSTAYNWETLWEGKSIRELVWRSAAPIAAGRTVDIQQKGSTATDWRSVK